MTANALKLAVAHLVCGCLSLFGQGYGLNQRLALGPFLNNALPPREQSAGWTTVQAFPNLTFNTPVLVIPEPRTNRLYVCELGGRVYFFTNNATTLSKTLFLDLSAVTQAESDCGLLGLAFHPEFRVAGSTNRGYVYVWYSYSPSPISSPPEMANSYNRLSRFTVPDGSLVANPASELVLINQFDQSTWHSGGGMFFGPDGFLYLSLGDEGGSNDFYNNTQKTNASLFSGVIRIDVDRDPSRSHPIRRQPQNGGTVPGGWPNSFTANYYIPNDNPWLDPGGSVLEEFYCIGLRNPHRMTFDAPSGRIWAGDVGQSAFEEVDLIEKGANYQWAYMEGPIAGPKAKPSSVLGVETPPIYAYPQSGGGSIIGGYVYRGSEHAAYLYGKYIFADYVLGTVWSLDYDGISSPTATLLCNIPVYALTSFGVDGNGEVYLCRADNGKLYKLSRTTDQVPPPPPLLSQTAAFTNLLSLAPNPALIPYDVNSPLWSDGAVKSRWMAVPNNGAPYGTNETISFSTNGTWSFPTGTVFVKHFELPINETNASLRKRLETRFLTRGTNGNWYGLTYKWRSDNTDADLLPSSLSETNLITTATGVRTQVWYYPSRQDCQTCHNPNAKSALGLRTCQINGDFTYPSTGVTDNQIRTLNHIGLFNTNLNEATITNYPKSVSLTNTTATLEHRVRSYLDANCAHCHRPDGVRAFFDARLDTPLNSQGIINGAVGNTLGISGAKVVVPQSVGQSVLYVRDNLVGPNQMPPLAKNVVDTNYIGVLAQWINALPPTGLPSPWDHADIGGVGVPGDASYYAGTFTLNGSGVDIWDVADSFHFAYRPLVGNCVLTARVGSLTDTFEWALTGVMIRQNLTAGSQHAMIGCTSEHGISFTRRLTAGATSIYNPGALFPAPYWVRIARSGNVFIGYQSPDGVNWTAVGTNTISMTGTVYVGLALTSANNGVLGTSAFDNVLLTGTNVNNPPTISAIAPQTISEDAVAGPLAFTIGDIETPAASLTLNRTSSVPVLVPLTNIVFGGSGSNRTVTVTPATNASGSGTITISVNDGSNTVATSFLLNVLPVNDLPVSASDVVTRWMSQGVLVPTATLLTNDMDVEGDPLSLNGLGVASPAGATVTQSNDIVRYWPPFGSTNQGGFTYVVSDGNGGSATGLVTIAVMPDPATPDLLGIAADSGTGVTVQLTGVPGFSYTVQYTDQLAPPNWLNLAVATADGLGQIQVVDATLNGNITRFYRAVRGVAP